MSVNCTASSLQQNRVLANRSLPLSKHLLPPSHGHLRDLDSQQRALRLALQEVDARAQGSLRAQVAGDGDGAE